MITLGTLSVYQYAVYQNFSEPHTRTMVFLVLITANIFLTLANRSFYYSVFTTLKYKNNLVLLIIGITILLTGLMLFVPPITSFFEFDKLNFNQILLSIGAGFVAVMWFELIKLFQRIKGK
jgi:Ca2+-transporting ATPase